MPMSVVESNMQTGVDINPGNMKFNRKKHGSGSELLADTTKVSRKGGASFRFYGL
ncbi:hypothetical protein Mapa_009845 [Marchantia paleacea]|nr:hypothetical protein Mapa_009845 [Marchantia paleacea]